MDAENHHNAVQKGRRGRYARRNAVPSNEHRPKMANAMAPHHIGVAPYAVTVDEENGSVETHALKRRNASGIKS